MIQDHPQFYSWYIQAIETLDGVVDVYESHEEDLLAIEQEVASSDQCERDLARRQRNFAIWGMVLAVLFGIGSIVASVIIYYASQ